MAALDNAVARFRRFAWVVLAYNILVVIFGALVRATGSGAGCGAHWPLCNGEVVPRAPELKTIIEFSHRLTSGLAGIAVVALAIWAWRLFPKGHHARRAAVAGVVLILVEGALGAGLVLFRYVDQNLSVGRAVYLSLHLVNTLLLLGTIALTAAFAENANRRMKFGMNFGFAIAALPIAMLVSVSGAIAALGDTLFPASSLSEGLRADFSSTAHLLVRLRVLHPGLAVVSGAYILFAVLSTVRSLPAVRVPALSVGVLVLVQLGAGALNVALLAPTWMQMVHLLIADLLWVALVLLALEAARNTAAAEVSPPARQVVLH